MRQKRMLSNNTRIYIHTLHVIHTSQCALRCQDWVLLLSQLFSTAEVVAACNHIVSVWEPLAVEWRKITLATRDAEFLPPCMLVLQGVDVLEKALEQVCLYTCVLACVCVCMCMYVCLYMCVLVCVRLLVYV